MIRGFTDKAKEAKTSVTGGHSVLNPWLMIGGAAMSVVNHDDIIWNNAQVGDKLILTKPLGTQLATNLKEWMVKEDPIWKKSQRFMNKLVADYSYDQATYHMSTLNMYAASLMKKYQAHGATDVTGFGILGHAKNLAEAQPNKVDFVINNLPIIPGTDIIERKIASYGLF